MKDACCMLCISCATLSAILWQDQSPSSVPSKQIAFSPANYSSWWGVSSLSYGGTSKLPRWP